MSIIQEKDYLSQLYVIQSDNPPSQVLFPKVKTIYDIDLFTREIKAPQFLAVEKDHESETIYFRVDRYHDFIDLSQITGIVQYTTPDKVTHYSTIPFYDVITEKEDNKMLIPWIIDGTVTQFKGAVTFSLRFFKVERLLNQYSDEIDDEAAQDAPGEVVYNLIYNLTTLPATSKVLEGMEVDELKSEFAIPTNAVADFEDRISRLEAHDGAVYWIIA